MMLSLQQRSPALQCVRIAISLILLSSCLFYLWQSSDVNNFQQHSQLHNYLLQHPSDRHQQHHAAIHNPYTISAVFIGLSFFAGCTLRIVIGCFVVSLDRIVARYSSAFLSLLYASFGSVALWLAVDQIGSLISSLLFLSRGPLSLLNDLRLSLFLCTASTVIQALFVADLLYSLPLLLDLHSAEPEGTSLLIDSGGDSGESLGDAFRRLSFTTEMEATVTSCSMCHNDSSCGNLLFGHRISEKAELLSNDGHLCHEMEVIHVSCAANYCLFNHGNAPPAWIPIDELDGRKLFIWIYIAILLLTIRAYVFITSYSRHSLSTISQFVNTKLYSSNSSIQHAQQPLLQV